MLKFVTFLFILSNVIFITDYSPTIINANNQTQTSPTPEKNAKIKLSKNSLKIPCSPGNLPSEGEICDENMTIDVSAFSDNTNDSLTYKYEVTGGQIGGQGKNVFWNLVNVSPGTYQIFAQLKDSQSRILDISETKTITVENCNCGGDCFCENYFEITSPDIISDDSTVKRGDKIVFMVSLGGTSPNTVFTWNVRCGEIIYKNYENSMIRVKINSDKTEKELKVSVKVENYDDCLCYDEASKTTKIADESKISN